MSLAGEYDPPSARDGNNPASRPSQNKSQLLEATMRNVPKLKELNYTQWKNVITNSIKKAKLWGYVDGSAQEPSEHDASNLTMYFDETAAVRNAILGSLESGAQRYIEEALDPRDAWLALEKKYLTAEGETDSKLVSIEKQLADLRLEEGGDMVEHIAEFCRMRCQLNGTRFALDDPASISMLYRSLPLNYRQLVLTPEGAEMKDFGALCARLSYLSQNPEPEAPIGGTLPSSAEDYTNWGVPEDVKTFGLTGDKNPLLEERAAVTCRDCLLKGHKSGTSECPQYEWRRELWGESHENANRLANASEETNTQLLSKSIKKFTYEFSESVKVALTFQELNFKEHLFQHLNRSNLRTPHGIQQCAILPAINGRNVIAQAPSETGKTTAVLLSAVQLTDSKRGGVQALIVSPTEQKVTDIKSMSESLGYKCHISTSSQSIADEMIELAEGHGFSILAGTPDRALQLFRRGRLRATEIKILVLDDLDILVDNGLNLLISDIYRCLPHSVQTLSTGTALPAETLKEILPYINNPLYITIGQHESVLREVITHAFIVVPQKYSNQKQRMLRQIISQAKTQILAGILCDTFAEVEDVQSQIQHCTPGSNCITESSKSEWHHRAVNYLRDSKSHLVTTSSVPLRRMLGTWNGDNFWIVNYNVPSSPQHYAERIHYLGFCNGKNTAITLINDGTDEINMIREIEQHFDIQMVELRWDGTALH